MFRFIQLVSISLITLIIQACPSEEEKTTPTQKSSKAPSLKIKSSSSPIRKKLYQNEIFWEVSIDKIGAKYSVKGKSKSNINSFNYVVEDGHDQLLNNSASTYKNNNEWSTFNFKFEAKKIEKNTTLILALFEKNLKNSNKNNTLTIPLE